MDPPPADSDETRDLLRRAEAGDRAARAQLLDRHRDYLRRFVELRLDPKLAARIDPSDVVQDAHLEAFRRLDDYLARRPMPFRLWLRKTAEERLHKVRRAHGGAARRAVEREVRLPDRSSLLLAQQLRAAGSSPSKRFSRAEAGRLVADALARLPEADREILLLRHFEGLSYDEVSHLLAIDAAAARKRYGRALLRLRQRLIDGGLLEEPAL